LPHRTILINLRDLRLHSSHLVSELTCVGGEIIKILLRWQLARRPRGHQGFGSGTLPIIQRAEFPFSRLLKKSGLDAVSRT
jgi:hypothetical protein